MRDAGVFTPDAIRQGKRIYVDGVDVTDRAFEAHPAQGFVLAYVFDTSPGNPEPGVRRVVLTGKVEIR